MLTCKFLDSCDRWGQNGGPKWPSRAGPPFHGPNGLSQRSRTVTRGARAVLQLRVAARVASHRARGPLARAPEEAHLCVPDSARA